MTSPDYILETHEHGWLLCAPPLKAGIPSGALGECMKIFPEDAVLSGGIPVSLNARGYHATVIMAVGSPAKLALWEKEINDQLADRPPEDRWWYGTERGDSAMSIFRVLCSAKWKQAASQTVGRLGVGTVPHDGGDFRCCKRLIELFPEWRDRLPEVAAAYPETKWPAIIARWDELSAASPSTQYIILSSL